MLSTRQLKVGDRVQRYQIPQVSGVVEQIDPDGKFIVIDGNLHGFSDLDESIWILLENPQPAPQTKKATVFAIEIGSEQALSDFVRLHGLVRQSGSKTDLRDNLLTTMKGSGQNVYVAYERVGWHLAPCPSQQEIEMLYQSCRRGYILDLRFYVGNVPEMAYREGRGLN